MPTMQELLAKHGTESVKPKLLKLIERIGRINPAHHMKLVMLNQKIKDGKQIGSNDVDLIRRLYDSLKS